MPLLQQFRRSYKDLNNRYGPGLDTGIPLALDLGALKATPPSMRIGRRAWGS